MAMNKRKQIANTNAQIQELWVNDEARFYHDATVKHDLYVEGLIFGTQSLEDFIATEAQDFKVHKDIVVQDDQTTKGDIYVEGDIRGIVDLNITGALACGVDTFTDADTTPSVAGGNVFLTANTGATDITGFDDGKAGQRITIIFNDNNTTLIHSAGLNLQGGSDFYGNIGDILDLIYSGSAWYETSRSLNS